MIRVLAVWATAPLLWAWQRLTRDEFDEFIADQRRRLQDLAD